MKILLLASGGDSPGMNAFLAKIYNSFNKEDVFCCIEGYKGLIENNIIPMYQVDPNAHKFEAGSMVYSSRSKEFQTQEGFAKGLANLSDFDVLVVLGGNGSCEGAKRIMNAGVNVIFAPGTIDNDVDGTEYSIGFDTAVKECVYAIENTMPSMNSFSRTCIFEVMGRHSSEIAKETANRCNVDYLICEESDLDYDKIAKIITDRYNQRKGTTIVIRENILDIKEVIVNINKNLYIGDVIRSHIVGHVQRGGKPTQREIDMAEGFASLAVESIKNKQYNVGIYYQNGQFVAKKI